MRRNQPKEAENILPQGKTHRRGQALTACKTGSKLPLLASNPPKSHPDNRKTGQKGQNRPYTHKGARSNPIRVGALTP